MASVLWTAAALGVGSVILLGVAAMVMPGPASGRDEGPPPPTALQRASRWSVGLALIPAVGAAALVGVVGPERAGADAGLRIGLSVLAVAALVAAGGGAWWVRRRSGTGGVVLDERDRAILERAPAVQSLATVVALAAWTVVLTERFWGAGGVPLAYLQLVFWSCLLVNLLGLPVGVLIGYRKG